MPASGQAAFDEMLADLRLTDRQREVARGRIGHLDTFFRTNYQLGKAPWAIGSYNRETLIRWERDVDVMVALSVAAYWPRYKDDSRAFLAWIRDGLNREYHTTRVSTRLISVRLFLGEEMEVDLVPSFVRQGGGYLIPNGLGGWRSTNPPFHHDLIKAANVRLASRLKPLVRLLKAWNNANEHPLRSFHVEMMVLSAHRTAYAVPAWSTAVAQSLASLAGQVAARCPDPWAPPLQFIDDDLSGIERQSARNMLAADAASAARALQLEQSGRHRQAFGEWDKVYRGKFPAYG